MYMYMCIYIYIYILDHHVDLRDELHHARARRALRLLQVEEALLDGLDVEDRLRLGDGGLGLLVLGIRVLIGNIP